MPMYWDAYLADTTHLTTEEHGAYLLLLAAMWRRDGHVPDNDRDLARIVGLTPAKWAKVKARILPFLIVQDGTLTQKNLLKIWQETQGKIAKNRENGAKGGRPKSLESKELDKPDGSVSVTPNETIPEPEPYLLPEAYASGPLVDPAKDLIDRGVAYLGRHRVEERQARSLIGKWRKEAGDQRLRAAFRECQAQSIADPVSWITATLRPPAQTDLAAIMASIGPDLR
jgi:uncharacterized protein YdaU (DUF1376 family)